MKNIVIYDEYAEVDLKPAELMEEYARKTEEDIKAFLLNSNCRDISCPVCQVSEKRTAFKKFSLQYQECLGCHSLFVSPRPDETVLDHYYTQAGSRAFWREKICSATSQKRKEKIIQPRVEWIIESSQEFNPGAQHYLDLNTSQEDFGSALNSEKFFSGITLLDPLFNAENFGHGEVIRACQRGDECSLAGQVDVISAFEIINRVSDIDTFFRKISDMLKSNGLCFLTVILGSGLDIQVLWDKSANAFPPDRLNLPTVEGLQKLFSRHAFECLEFSTPGVLDVEIVSKALSSDPGLPISRFVRQIIEKNDESSKRNFQEYLQKNLMSSYGRVLLRKRGK